MFSTLLRYSHSFLMTQSKTVARLPDKLTIQIYTHALWQILHGDQMRKSLKLTVCPLQVMACCVHNSRPMQSTGIILVQLAHTSNHNLSHQQSLSQKFDRVFVLHSANKSIGDTHHKSTQFHPQVCNLWLQRDWLLSLSLATVVFRLVFTYPTSLKSLQCLSILPAEPDGWNLQVI